MLAATMPPATGAPVFAASLAALEMLYTDLRAFLDQVDDACVTWVPPAPDTNAIAGIVRHLLGATASWVTRALGEELGGRDRLAELRATDGAGELAGHVDRALEDLRRRFARLESVDPASLRRFELATRPGPREESAAWCVQRAVIHAGEHWGQAQLTRQWYDQAHAR
jgi:hypothetical protein